MVSMCSATKPAQYAAKDLIYLRSISSQPTTSTVMGSVWRYTHDPNFKPKFEPSIMDHYRPPEQEYMAMAPVPGFSIVVKADNGAEHAAISDRNGDWQISSLAPGAYTVDAHADESTFVYPSFARSNLLRAGVRRSIFGLSPMDEFRERWSTTLLKVTGPWSKSSF